MTPQGRGRSPPSPKRSEGEPPCGVDGTRRPRPEQRRQREGDVLRSDREEEDASGHTCQPHRTKPAAKIIARPLIASPPALARSRRNTKGPPLSLVTSPRLHAEGAQNWIERRRSGRLPPRDRHQRKSLVVTLIALTGDAGMVISRAVGLLTCRSRGSRPGPPWWNSSPRPCGSRNAASRSPTLASSLERSAR